MKKPRESWPPQKQKASAGHRLPASNYSPSILPDRPWYRRTTAVVSAIAGIIGLVSGSIALWKTLAQPPSVANNIEMVVDTSAAFDIKLRETTKSAATAEAINTALTLVSTSDNLALRTFGGSCDRQGTRLVHAFAQNNHQLVREALKSETYKGARPLVRAILEASGDFNDSQRFGDKVKKLIVITGGGDDCPESSKLPNMGADLIRQRLQELKIRADLFVIGVGIPTDERARLASIASAAGGYAQFAENQDDITALLRHAINPATKKTPDILAWGMISTPPAGRSDYPLNQIEAQGIVFLRILTSDGLEELTKYWAAPLLGQVPIDDRRDWLLRAKEAIEAAGKLSTVHPIEARELAPQPGEFEYEVRLLTAYTVAGTAIEVLRFKNINGGPPILQSIKWCTAASPLVSGRALDAIGFDDACFQSRFTK